MKKHAIFFFLFINSILLFSQTIDPGSTEGILDVSLSGAATYSVPIVVPPGINNVAPQIALTYNSQSGNGIAGWGWNISGLSTIRRIPATEYHDGYIKPINLTIEDRYALDSQRLLLVSGTYGHSGSTYQIENYSNIKIICISSVTGGVYDRFKVLYPDGSSAIYSGSDSNSIEWKIREWTDPQGNKIIYSYQGTTDSNLPLIDKIRYGGNGTNQPNEIIFSYDFKKIIERNYYGGHISVNSKILKEIKIITNGNLFRKYSLNYNTNNLEFERLISIQESNSDNHSLEPIIFNYENPDDSNVFNHTETSLGLTSVNALNTGYISSDFDGDTNMDIIVYPKTGIDAKRKYWYMNEIGENSYNFPYEHNLGYTFHSIFPTKWLTHNNKVLNELGWTVVKEENNGYKFTVYSNGITNPIYYQYEKTITGFPTIQVSTGCDNSSGNQCETTLNEAMFPKELLSGDFNGDGLTDVLAIDKPLANIDCQYDWEQNCVSSLNYISSGKVYFIDLKRDLTPSFTQVGDIIDLPAGENSCKIETGDYDGDGKTDIFLIRQGQVNVFSLNNNNQLTGVTTFYNNNIHLATTLFGDFNGDGKTDFMQPVNVNQTNWNLYTSKASDFSISGMVSFQADIISLGLTYENGGHGYYWYKDQNNNDVYDCLHLNVSYIANDINGDNKSDIIAVRNFTDSNQCYPPGTDGTPVYSQIVIIENKGLFNLSNGQQGFNKKISDFYNYGLNRFPIPVFLNHNNLNRNLELSLLSNNKIHTFKGLNDNRESVLVREINNNGVKFKIEYKSLLDDYYNGRPVTEINTYKPSDEQIYPNINIQNAPELSVVRSIELWANSFGINTFYQRKRFSYYNAVANLQGLGFLGFKGRLATSWYNSDVQGPVSNVTLHDFDKRGAITDTYNSLGFQWSFENIPSNYINKTTYQYQTTNNPGQVFINLPLQVSTQNKLDDTSQIVNYTYDSFNNIESATINLYNGFNYNTYLGQKNSTFSYFNNPVAIDNTYHIGRIHLKTDSSNMYNDTFTTEEEFLYYSNNNSNLVEFFKKRGYNTDWLTEKYDYDDFGNIIRKELLGYNRVELFEYNNENNNFNRFLTKSTDIEGLETTYNYHHIFGTITNKIDPYGNENTYVYNAWGRLIFEEDYLRNRTFYSFITEPDGGVLKRTEHPNRQIETFKYNVLGWLTNKSVIGLNGNLILTEINYDKLGRQIDSSEPHFQLEPHLWNNYTYDQYGRPKSTTLSTGKVITTTYNGRNVSVNDGIKTVTTTKDANGNTKSTTDEGGTVNYTYYANGEMKTANYNGRTVSTQIDGWGRKTQLNDPDAGRYTYSYNDIGELLEETTPRGTTSYIYDDFGKLLQKSIIGEHTNMELSYNYNNESKLLSQISGFDYNENKSYFQQFSYDDEHRRLIGIQESLDDYHVFRNTWSFDELGRKKNEELQVSSSVYGNSLVSITNEYSDEGVLYEIKESNSELVLWHLNTENAQGQAKEIVLGNDIKLTRQINPYGFFEEYKDYRSSNASNPILHLNYNFDELTGNLLDRNRLNNNFNSTENFNYDNLDRLKISNSTYGNHSQTYDSQGRILNNSNIGDYNYVRNKYQVSNIKLNNTGKNYYQEHVLQNIIYNAFKKPISIYEKGKGRVDFLYNPISLSRAIAYYGSEDEDIENRPFVKYYSSIVPIEITEDKVNGNVKITTFVGGDAYSAPIVHIKETGANPKNDFYYLHRDYLGSILAITDSNANIVEQRQFGAWGNTDKFSNSAGDTQFNNYTTLLNRGYTGHEHFFDVGLINMNGRMYDPKIGRMLSPDNFVENPFDTQSYNRYSYVRNNPLAYVDQNGENPFLIAAAVLLGYSYLNAAHANRDKETGAWSWNPLNWFGSDNDTNIVIGVNTNGNFTNTTVYGGVGSSNYIAVAGYNNNEGVSFGSWTPGSGANLTAVNPPDTEAQWMNTLNQEIADAHQASLQYKWDSSIANNVGQPGTWESLIPIWGSGRSAIDHFQEGNYWRGTGYSILAVSDVFLVKSIATGIGKGAWKFGSHTWSATRKWLGKNGYAEYGQPMHHWLISQSTAKKYGLEALTNQPWNLMTFPNQSLHIRAGHGMMYYGQEGYSIMGQIWYGTPTWPKVFVSSYTPRLGDID